MASYSVWVPYISAKYFQRFLCLTALCARMALLNVVYNMQLLLLGQQHLWVVPVDQQNVAVNGWMMPYKRVGRGVVRFGWCFNRNDAVWQEPKLQLAICLLLTLCVNSFRCLQPQHVIRTNSVNMKAHMSGIKNGPFPTIMHKPKYMSGKKKHLTLKDTADYFHSKMQAHNCLITFYSFCMRRCKRSSWAHAKHSTCTQHCTTDLSIAHPGS